jgi:putative transcriptional regulator
MCFSYASLFMRLIVKANVFPLAGCGSSDTRAYSGDTYPIQLWDFFSTQGWSVVAKAEIQNRVRKLRFENNEMTQQELADRAGCTRQTIVALEQGKYVPSLALAFRIAKVFRVQIEDVFEYQE